MNNINFSVNHLDLNIQKEQIIQPQQLVPLEVVLVKRQQLGRQIIIPRDLQVGVNLHLQYLLLYQTQQVTQHQMQIKTSIPSPRQQQISNYLIVHLQEQPKKWFLQTNPVLCKSIHHLLKRFQLPQPNNHLCSQEI